MAIKEEQYDPGYEDAYGGAYADRGAEGDQAPNQTNGHCTFSSAEHRGNVLHGLVQPQPAGWAPSTSL